MALFSNISDEDIEFVDWLRGHSSEDDSDFDYEEDFEDEDGDRMYMHDYESWKLDEEGRYRVQLSYHFPEDNRNPWVNVNGKQRKYGTDMPLRDLYETLCTKFNNGKYFIDEYFEQFSYYSEGNQMLKEYATDVLASAVEGIKAAMVYKENEYSYADRTKSGRLDRRKRAYKQYTAWRSDYTASRMEGALKDLSSTIKDDIIHKLATGQIWMSNPVLAEKTIRKKTNFGFAYPRSKFFATGQLIHSIAIDFKVVGSEAA